MRSLGLTAVLAGGLLALTACGTSTGAQDHGSSTTVPSTQDVQAAGGGWCSGADLDIDVTEEVSPNSGARLFAIHFAAANSADTCRIGGTLSDVTFAARDGAPVDIEIGGGQDPDYSETPVGDGREAVVYVRADGVLGGQPVATVSFTLPGKETRGDAVTVDWPAPFDGPIEVTNLMAPVS